MSLAGSRVVGNLVRNDLARFFISFPDGKPD